MNGVKTVAAFGFASRVICAGALMGCASGAVNSSTSAPTDASLQGRVLSCYEAEYRRHHGTAPRIDDNERRAADQLIEKYNRKLQKVCGTIQVALSGKLCGLPPTLDSVAACEGLPRQGKHPDADLNPAVKARMDQRIHIREQQQAIPGQGP